jgi:hypothetical protein
MERELDRAIDVAGETLMAREPSRALSHRVMARVRGSAAPAPRRFVWVAAAVTVVLVSVIATAVISQMPLATPSLPGSRPLTVGQPAVAPERRLAVLGQETPRRMAHVRVQRRTLGPAPFLPADVSPIEPIETQPIAMTAIDVPQLERETTLIDAITIEPLTIEPLSASND